MCFLGLEGSPKDDSKAEGGSGMPSEAASRPEQRLIREHGVTIFTRSYTTISGHSTMIGNPGPRQGDSQ